MRRLALCLLLSGCASAPPLVAGGSSRAAPVVVDGRADEWGATLVAVAGQPLTVGVRSDAEAVTVAAVMTNPAVVREAVRHGLVVWLDPAGGRRRALGVQVPVHDGAPPDADLERLVAAPARVAVTRDGARTVYAADGAPGVAVATGLDRGAYVVELRVPLGAGRYGLGVAPGATVGLGVETASAPRDDLRARTEARADRGAAAPGRGSASAQRGTGADPDGEAARRARAEASRVALWLRVALAG